MSSEGERLTRSERIGMRLVFWAYLLLIVAGLAAMIVIGLDHH